MPLAVVLLMVLLMDLLMDLLMVLLMFLLLRPHRQQFLFPARFLSSFPVFAL